MPASAPQAPSSATPGTQGRAWFPRKQVAKFAGFLASSEERQGSSRPEKAEEKETFLSNRR
jgi:hypothetical protein